MSTSTPCPAAAQSARNRRQPAPAAGLRAAALLLLGCIPVASCSDDDSAQKVPRSEGSFASHRDLFDGVELNRGETLPTSRVAAVTRGTWRINSRSGGGEGPVKDRGGFPMGTIVFGSGEEGVDKRSIQVTAPSGLTPGEAHVRFWCNDGTKIKLRAVTLTPEPVFGDWVEFSPSDDPQSAVLSIPSPEAMSSLVVEIDGDNKSPHFTEIKLVERTQPGTTARPERVGAEEPRTAIGLAAGASVTSNSRIEGPAQLTMSLATLGRGSGKLTVEVTDGGVAVLTKTQRVGDSWEQATLLLPETKGDVAVTVSNTGGSGVWVSEARVDSLSGTPPTVLLVTSDTHRGDHIGAFGADARVQTPHLDALAERGVYFTNCYAPTNVTNPSHMALMTGLSLRETRVLNNVTALSLSAQTLAEEFQAAGYRTLGAVSVMHLKPEQSNLNQGFDRYDAPPEGKRNGQHAVQKLKEWMDESEGVPLFIWLHVYDAHAPYSPPKRLLERRYDGDPKNPDLSLDIEVRALAPWIQKSKATDRAYFDALYAGGVDYVDELLGEVLTIDRVANGVCAITADHGESLGEDTVWWDHLRLNHSTVHIPLILSWPGATPQRSEFPVEQIDVGRTLLSISGIESDFPGDDLRVVLDGKRGVEPRYSISAHAWTTAIEVDGWLLVLQMRPFGANRRIERNWDHGETQLYNLREDPSATVDVLEENFERAREMRSALTQWLNSGTSDGLTAALDLSEEAKASLRALGYAAGPKRTAKGNLWQPNPEAPWNKRFAD